MKITFTFFTSFILSFLSYSQSFDVETIWQSGPIDKRINYVILGDGYQSSELDKFITDATNTTNALFDESPYKEYKNFFNVFAIKVPSNESGASHPGTATDVNEPVHPVATVDNYFGSTFDYANIHRLLVPTNTSAINNVLADNFPTYDQVIIIVNSSHYGGSGGVYATTSTNSNSNQIAIHELGHSFVSLADEYYAGDGYAREKINMTQETDPSQVKWASWMNDNGIGIYQHCCNGNSSSWYRPHQSCKMRSLNNSFCSVCTEGTVKQIHELINFIESFTPENTENINLVNEQTFSVDIIEPNPSTMEIEWKLNGTIINDQDSSVLVSVNDLSSGDNELTVTVTDNTSFLRVDSNETFHIATVNWNFSNTLSINDVTTEKFKLELFPNPTQDIIYLNQNLNEKYTLTITDITGKELIKKRNLANKSQISLKQLNAGVYLINFHFNNGIKLSRKIIKK